MTDEPITDAMTNSRADSFWKHLEPLEYTNALYDEEGSWVGLVGTITDLLADRKVAMEIIEAASESVCIWDVGGGNCLKKNRCFSCKARAFIAAVKGGE